MTESAPALSAAAAQSDAMAQKYKKRDDASARLGEKMLQGWTLLGVTCPTDGCFTPFVRNKQGQMYCVSCEQFAMTEDEAQKQKQREKELEKQHEEELEKEREQRIHELFHEEEQRKAAEAQQLARARAAAQANGSAKRKSEEVPLSSQADDDHVNALRRQALAALYQKVEALSNSLSANDHSERLSAVSKTIRELSEAIKTLSSSNDQ